MIQVANKWRIQVSILEKQDNLVFYVNENWISNVLIHLSKLEFVGNVTGITIGTHIRPENK